MSFKTFSFRFVHLRFYKDGIEQSQLPNMLMAYFASEAFKLMYHKSIFLGKSLEKFDIIHHNDDLLNQSVKIFTVVLRSVFVIFWEYLEKLVAICSKLSSDYFHIFQYNCDTLL